MRFALYTALTSRPESPSSATAPVASPSSVKMTSSVTLGPVTGRLAVMVYWKLVAKSSQS